MRRIEQMRVVRAIATQDAVERSDTHAKIDQPLCRLRVESFGSQACLRTWEDKDGYSPLICFSAGSKRASAGCIFRSATKHPADRAAVDTLGQHFELYRRFP